MVIEIIKAISPIIVALVALIPTIISNRKKTQDSITEFNQSISKKVKDLHDDLNSVKENLANHIAEDEDETAENWRVRILRLDNEIRHSKVYPTQEMMAQGRRDCDKYKAYCEARPSFHNGIGESAIKRIESTDDYCATNNCYEQLKIKKP